MKFHSRRSVLISIVIWGAIALLAYNSVETIQHGGRELWFLVLTTLVGGFLLWMWAGTYYVITGNELQYRSGPINGVIDVKSIHAIVAGKSMYVGLKPALATKGCIIKYNKYDDIYLSPKHQEQFIAELVKINPDIEVIGDGSLAQSKQ